MSEKINLPTFFLKKSKKKKKKMKLTESRFSSSRTVNLYFYYLNNLFIFLINLIYRLQSLYTFAEEIIQLFKDNQNDLFKIS